MGNDFLSVGIFSGSGPLTELIWSCPGEFKNLFERYLKVVSSMVFSFVLKHIVLDMLSCNVNCLLSENEISMASQSTIYEHNKWNKVLFWPPTLGYLPWMSEKFSSRNVKKKEKCGICSCIFMRICKHFLATRSAKIPWLNYFGIARPQLFAQLKKFAAPRMYTSSLNIYIYLSHNGVIIHNLNRNCALKLSLEGMRKLSYCSRHCL